MSLIGNIANTKIKLCGMTRAQDVEMAVALNVWAVGFILYPKSPRYIAVKELGKLIKNLTLSQTKTVGVFVNPTLSDVCDAVENAELNKVQLHGYETQEFVDQIKVKYTQVEVIKALRIDLNEAKVKADYQLIDHLKVKPNGELEWGGSGEKVDWKKAAQLSGDRIILAGGLDSSNVAQAIQMVKPYAVDVSSGIEDAPGVKSEIKMKEFCEAVRRSSI